MMERRVLLAALLSAIVMVSYARMTGLDTPRIPSQPQPSTTQPIAPAQASESSQIVHALPDEELVALENPVIRIELGKETAAIRRVVFKEHRSLQGTGPVIIGNSLPISTFEFPDGVKPRLQEATGTTATWNLEPAGDKYQQILVQIDIHKPLVYLKLQHQLASESAERDKVTLLSTWEKGDELPDRYNMLEIIMLTIRDSRFQREYLRYSGLQRNQRNVPRGTPLLTLSDRYFCQSVKLGHGSARTRVLPSQDGRIVTAADLPAHGEAELTIYFGSRDYKAMKASGFERAFPLGFLGWVGLCLLWSMKILASVTRNYGVAIILFSALISCFLAPFTLLGMKSMKKLQVLKPEIDRIMARHKGNPQKGNVEVMQLYKQHRVSPLGGCLPMLLQFPILIALFRSISNFLELRGASFLWIKDLSLPDRAATLPWGLPILGNHLNVLPLVMTGAMLVQMRLSQQRVPQDKSNPFARAMSGPMMAIVFGFMFYQVPAGLVLYWLTSTLVNIAWYRTV